jgi:cytochrome c-type biogenesis protein CcsB
MSRALLASAMAFCVAGLVAYIPKKPAFWRLAKVLHILALALLTASLVLRSVQTGQAPFATTQEFASTFAWGTVVVGLVFALRRSRPLRSVSALSLGIAAVLLTWVVVDYPQARGLAPALQNNPLFISHVGTAAVAYGAFAVAFGAAVGRLFVRDSGPAGAPPKAELLDSVCYKSARIGFLLFTVTLLLGSMWADVAWGSFWSWDPKETASLLTWLVFATYLHSRLLSWWTAKRSALIVVIGFLAVVTTFLGNFFFSGLHAYN